MEFILTQGPGGGGAGGLLDCPETRSWQVRDLDRAIALDPGYAESHYERGRLRIELGQYPQGD